VSEEPRAPAEQLQAVHRGACPSCGAQSRWDPAKQALVCPYCGTVSPGNPEAEAGGIREIDLLQALRDLPEEARGWRAEKRSVRCRSCHAVSVFDPEQVGTNCSFCGSPELVAYEDLQAPIRPESLLPFRVDAVRVRESIRKWLAGKWLAPGRLSRSAFVDTVSGVYLPYWTFDSAVSCRWTADSGTYYWVSETFRGPDGKMQQRQVRRTRWRPAAGELSHFFDDELIPATHGIHPKLLGRIEPFPTGDLLPYDTAYLAGFVVEHYQVILPDAAERAAEVMHEKLTALCAAQVPGDTYRNLRVDADWTGRTFKHILVPVWLLTYRYAGKPFQLVANGVSGQLAGEYPKSPWKVALLVVGILAAVAAIVWFATQSG
jgi:hypothetical protein